MTEDQPEQEPPPMDVREILQDNLRHRKDKPIEIERTSSRRNRDYIVVTILANLLLTGLFFLGSRNAVSVIFFLSGLVILNGALAWVMFAVISDY